MENSYINPAWEQKENKFDKKKNNHANRFFSRKRRLRARPNEIKCSHENKIRREIKRCRSFHLSFDFCFRAPPRTTRRTVGRMTMILTRGVLGRLFLRAFVCSHRSLIRLLRTARFAGVLRYSYLFARSWEKGSYLWIARVDFTQFQPTVRRDETDGIDDIATPSLQIAGR